MTRLEWGTSILEKLVPMALASILTFSAAGFFAEKAAPLEKRIHTLEIEQTKTMTLLSAIAEDMLRRLDRIERKVDLGRK